MADSIRTGVGKLRTNDLIRRAAMVASGAAAGQIAVAAASPILSRWFDPESFGLLGAFLGLATILGTCGALRFELAVQSAATEDEAENVAALALRTAAASAVLALAVVAIVGLSGTTREITGLGSARWLLPPTMLAVSVFNVGVFWSIRRGLFRSVARARVVLGVGTVAPQLLAGLLGFGVIGLLIGPLVGWGTAALVLLVAARLNPARPSGEPLGVLVKRHRRFPLFSLWSALFNRGALEIPVIMLLALFDQRAAGLFYLCNRVLIVPANVIAEGVYQSFLNRAGELARTNADELRRLTRRTVGMLAGAVVVPVAIGMAVIPPAIPIVFGAAWQDAGPLALRLLPMVGTLLIAVPVSSQLWLLGRQELELGRDALRFFAVLAVFVISRTAEWSLITTVTAYSIVMGAAYLTTVGLVLYVTGRHQVSNEKPVVPTTNEPKRLKEVAAHG